MTVLLPVRLAYWLTKGSLVVGYRAGRVAGYRRLTVFGIGVGVGMLIAPAAGRELRDRLLDAWDRWTGGAPAAQPIPAPPPPGTAPVSAPPPTDMGTATGGSVPGTGSTP